MPFIAGLLILLMLFVIVLLAKTVRIIPQARAGIVERFGKYKETLPAGLNVVVPLIDRVRYLLDLRAQVGVGAALGDAESKVTAIARTTGSAAERDGDPRVTPRAEAALLVGLPLGRHLGVIAGPVISTSKLEVDHRGAVETTMTGGLRYRF